MNGIKPVDRLRQSAEAAVCELAIVAKDLQPSAVRAAASAVVTSVGSYVSALVRAEATVGINERAEKHGFNYCSASPARRYAGQKWKHDVLLGDRASSGVLHPESFLMILARDVREDAKDLGIIGDRVELWVNTTTLEKGLFIGDTSALSDEGWTPMASIP